MKGQYKELQSTVCRLGLAVMLVLLTGLKAYAFDVSGQIINTTNIHGSQYIEFGSTGTATLAESIATTGSLTIGTDITGTFVSESGHWYTLAVGSATLSGYSGLVTDSSMGSLTINNGLKLNDVGTTELSIGAGGMYVNNGVALDSDHALNITKAAGTVSLGTLNVKAGAGLIVGANAIAANIGVTSVALENGAQFRFANLNSGVLDLGNLILGGSSGRLSMEEGNGHIRFDQATLGMSQNLTVSTVDHTQLLLLGAVTAADSAGITVDSGAENIFATSLTLANSATFYVRNDDTEAINLGVLRLAGDTALLSMEAETGNVDFDGIELASNDVLTLRNTDGNNTLSLGEVDAADGSGIIVTQGAARVSAGSIKVANGATFDITNSDTGTLNLEELTLGGATGTVAMQNGSGDVGFTKTTLGTSKVLSVSNADADNTLSLGAVTADNNSGLTVTAGVDKISADSVTVADTATFKLTNTAASTTLELGDLKLAGTSGTVALQDGNGDAGFATTTLGASKVLSVSNADADNTLSLGALTAADGSGIIASSGAAAIQVTSVNLADGATFDITNSDTGTLNLGALSLAGSTGAVAMQNGNGNVKFSGTTIADSQVLTVSNSDDTQTLSLGAVTLGDNNSGLTISSGAARISADSVEVGSDSRITNNDTSTLNLSNLRVNSRNEMGILFTDAGSGNIEFATTTLAAHHKLLLYNDSTNLLKLGTVTAENGSLLDFNEGSSHIITTAVSVAAGAGFLVANHDINNETVKIGDLSLAGTTGTLAVMNGNGHGGVEFDTVTLDASQVLTVENSEEIYHLSLGDIAAADNSGLIANVGVYRINADSVTVADAATFKVTNADDSSVLNLGDLELAGAAGTVAMQDGSGDVRFSKTTLGANEVLTVSNADADGNTLSLGAITANDGSGLTVASGAANISATSLDVQNSATFSVTNNASGILNLGALTSGPSFGVYAVYMLDGSGDVSFSGTTLDYMEWLSVKNEDSNNSLSLGAVKGAYDTGINVMAGAGAVSMTSVTLGDGATYAMRNYTASELDLGTLKLDGDTGTFSMQAANGNLAFSGVTLDTDAVLSLNNVDANNTLALGDITAANNSGLSVTSGAANISATSVTLGSSVDFTLTNSDASAGVFELGTLKLDGAGTVAMQAGSGDIGFSATELEAGEVLSVSNADADNTLSLGDLTAGNNSGLTVTAGVANISIDSVAVGSNANFKVTNGEAATTLNLGDLTLDGASGTVALQDGAGNIEFDSTTLSASEVLTVSNVDADNTLSLGAVTAGDGSGINAISGAARIDIDQIELGTGAEFKLTNGAASEVMNLGDLTLAGATGTVAMQDGAGNIEFDSTTLDASEVLTVSNADSDNTLALGAVTAAAGAGLKVDSGKQVLLDSLNITGVEAAGMTIHNYSNEEAATLDLHAITTQIGSITNDKLIVADGAVAGTTASTELDLQVDEGASYSSSGNSVLEAVTLGGELRVSADTTIVDTLSIGNNNNMAKLLVDNGAAITVSTGTTVGTGTAVSGQTSMTGKAALHITADSADTANVAGNNTNVNLGAIEMGNGTLVLRDSNSTVDTIFANGTSLTVNGSSLLTGANDGVTHELYIDAADFNVTNSAILYYDSTRVRLVADGSELFASSKFVDIGTINPNITTSMAIGNNKVNVFDSITYGAGDNKTFTVERENTVAALMGNSLFTDNTLTLTDGGKFTQLDTREGEATNFSSTGVVNMDGGTLEFSNSGVNTIGTLKIGSESSNALIGNAVTVSETEFAAGEVGDISILIVNSSAELGGITIADYSKLGVTDTAAVTADKLSVNAVTGGSTLDVGSEASFDNFTSETSHTATASKSNIAEGTFTVSGGGRTALRGFILGTAGTADGTLSYQNTNADSTIYSVTANGNGYDELKIGTAALIDAALTLKKFEAQNAAKITVDSSGSSLTIEGLTEGDGVKGLTVGADTEITNQGTVSVVQAEVAAGSTLTTSGVHNISVTDLELEGNVDNKVAAGYTTTAEVDTYAELAALEDAMQIETLTLADGSFTATGSNNVATAIKNVSVTANKTLGVDNTTGGMNALGIETLTLAGTLDLDATTGTTQTSINTLNVAAGDTGIIDVESQAAEVKVASTVVAEGGTLNVTDEDTTASVNLGDLVLSSANLDITDDSDDNVSTIYVSSITTDTGISSIKAGANGQRDNLAFTADTNLSLATTLIYNSSEVVFTDSSGNLLGTGSTDAEKIANFNSKHSNLFDTDGALDSSQVEYTAGVTVVRNLWVNGGTEETTLDDKAIVVATGNATVGVDESLDLMKGSVLLVQGTLVGNNATSKAELGGELILENASTMHTLNVTSDAATLSGNGLLEVAELDIGANNKLTLESQMKLTGAVAQGTGTLELSGDSTIRGVLDLDGHDVSTAGFGVTAGRFGKLMSTNGTATLEFVNGDIGGHLEIDSVILEVQAGGRLGISANTLSYTTDELTNKVVLNSGAYIDEQATAGDGVSHIEVVASGATAAQGTIDNSSTASNNVLGLLDVTAGDANTENATMTIDNTGATDGALTIRTANVTSGSAVGTANARIAVAASGAQANTVTIDTLNLHDTAYGSASVTVEDNATLSIGTLNFVEGGSSAVANDTSKLIIGNINVDAVTADEDVTGTIISRAVNPEGNITGTVTLTGGGASNRVATLRLSDVSKLTGNVVLAADANVAHAILDDSTAGSEIATLSVAAGKFGTLSNNAPTRVGTMNIDGSLAITNAYTLGANNTINIGSSGNLATGNLDVTSGKVVLDLGTDSQGAVTAGTAKYATIDVTGTLNYNANTDYIYGKNGISGTTYKDVIQVSGNDLSGLDGQELLASDAYRNYTLVNGDTIHDLNIEVTADISGIDAAVKDNGGTDVAAKEAEYLIEHQGEFNAEGQEYVAEMTRLSAPEFARAAEETIGEEATTATDQVALMSIEAAGAAVSNQLTSFRSGDIAAGLASSFNSGGATAAISDMADADTLAEAYEAGFTSGSDTTVYKQVQVWANGFGGFGEQGTDDSMIGYDFWNIGTMIGLDYAFARELRVGTLFGYSYNKTDVYWNSGDSSDNQLRFGAYASYNWDNFFVDISPTMGVHIIESKRNIWNGATAKGERTGIDFNISGTVGYTFNLPAEIQLTPSYSLGYTMFYDPDYTETGAGAANVKFDSYTTNSLLQDLGVRVGKLFRTSDDLAFLPEVWGGWELEYLNTGGTRDTTTAASIGSQTYGTVMNGMATNRAYWGLGLTALIKENVSVFGRYDQKIWDKGYNVGFTTGVKVSF